MAATFLLEGERHASECRAITSGVQRQIPPESKTIAWIIGHAATLLNLYTVGSDGKVPFERWRGRGHHMGRCAFGERVWYRVGQLTDRTKAEDRTESGISVGFRMKSSEYIVVANGEAITAWTIRRKLVSERLSANPEEIINVLVWPLGHRQEAAVRPMGERRERDRSPELDEAPLSKPLAEIFPSKRVYLKQSDFNAHGLTQGCPRCRACEKAYERKVTQWCAAREWKNCFKQQRRADNDCRKLNAAHGTRLVNEPPSESSSSSPTDQQIPRAVQ